MADTNVPQEAQAQAQDDDVVLPKEKQPDPFFDSKLFRILSLVLYLGGIGGMGMALSLYYLIFFDSQMPEIHLKFPVSIGGQPVQKVHDYQP